LLVSQRTLESSAVLPSVKLFGKASASFMISFALKE
jgi:hypothetical protein